MAWDITFAFDFYSGRTEDGLRPISVTDLWTGNFSIGYAKTRFKDAITPKMLYMPTSAPAVNVRNVLMGHGMLLNTDNAGEFLALWRRIKVHGQQWFDLLWKTDVHPKLVRTPGGKWKFSHAGWALGRITEPWIVDISKAIRPELSAKMKVIFNKTPNENELAAHAMGRQAIVFKKAS